MDRQSVFSSRVFPASYPGAGESNSTVRASLEKFILDFRLDNSFIYRSAYQSLGIWSWS